MFLLKPIVVELIIVNAAMLKKDIAFFNDTFLYRRVSKNKKNMGGITNTNFKLNWKGLKKACIMSKNTSPFINLCKPAVAIMIMK